MNITQIRQESRDKKIRQLANTLKKAKIEGKAIDLKLLVLEACKEWKMSERTIKEYLKIAKLSL